MFDETGKPLLRREPFTAPYDLVEIMKETAAGKVGNREFTDTKGERYFCFYRPVNLPNISTRWSLLVVRPYKSVTAALADTMNKTIFAGVLMAVLASFAAILFSRRFTKPLMEIMRVAQDVRGGNYDCKIEVQRSDEVGMLAEAINHMIGGLKSAKVQSQEAETQIRNIAYHDALTGLVNRMHFNVYARSNITASMTRGGTGALFFVDVDKFKHVNDTFGHGVGDELLNIFGQRLMMATGKYDRVCRFGGRPESLRPAAQHHGRHARVRRNLSREREPTSDQPDARPRLRARMEQRHFKRLQHVRHQRSDFLEIHAPRSVHRPRGGRIHDPRVRGHRERQHAPLKLCSLDLFFFFEKQIQREKKFFQKEKNPPT